MGVLHSAPRSTATWIASASLWLIVAAPPAAAQVRAPSSDRPAAPAHEESARAQRQTAEPSGFSFASFLKYLHTDVLWTPSETGAGMQGLVGVHLVVASIGRVNFFGPPGVMLVTQNTSTGKMVRVASTWGTSIYLVDFRLPGSGQTGRLFLNLGKAWTSGDHRSGINMIGLSATWKK